MLIVFVALIAGPLVAGKKIPQSAFDALKGLNLVQPTGLKNDDTLASTETNAQTGTANPSYSGWATRTMKTATSASEGTDATSSATNGAKIRLF